MIEVNKSNKRYLVETTIKRLRNHFIHHEMWPGATYWDINNGYCEEFAIEVLQHIKDADESLKIVLNENFMIEMEDSKEKIWDETLLKAYWPNVVPINGLTWNDLNQIKFGYHAWLTDGFYHYDAECPEGVDNYFLLPIFKSYIEK